MDQQTKNCQNCKQDFVIEPEDFQFYEKMKVPAPTWCPGCRLKRRLAWVNYRTLYSRPVEGKPMISMYAPDKQYNIVEDRKWWGDDFDLTDYGKEYDFSKPFFQQYNDLLTRVPLPHLQRGYSSFENSDYCNAAHNLKNCYLVFGADNSENVAYASGIVESKDCMDIAFANKSELSYECFTVVQCYRCFYCQDVENSSDMIFSQDCVGCNNCIGCFGLRNKSYYIFNESYSKEEYHQKLKEFNIGSFEGIEKLRQDAERFFLLQPHKFMHGRSNTDVSGDYMYHSKNVHNAVKVDHVEDCKYVFSLQYFKGGTVNAYDYSWFGCNAELVYESAWCGLGINNIRFSVWNYFAADLQYCYGCHYSQSMFGCVGLRNKKYCILNKQYTKEEYEALVPKSIEHMNAMPYVDSKGRVYTYGEFLPIELSPFDYNETMAGEFLPQTKQEVEKIGHRWHEPTERTLNPEISWKELPNNINDAVDDLVGKLISCRAFEEDEARAMEHNCTKVFKLTTQELSFYRKLGLSLPRLCFNSRHHERVRRLNLANLYNRTCMCDKNHPNHSGNCPNTFQTTYAPDHKEIEYCEQCYQTEII